MTQDSNITKNVNNAQQPAVVHTVDELRTLVNAARKDGKTIGFVPTMGALHDGHLSLIGRAQEHADFTVSSIFVNPEQFAPHEDFDTYPRTLDQDVEKLASLGCNVVFAPSVQEIYPEGFGTKIHIQSSVIEDMEHTCRPGFFDGVAIIVCKLLLQVMADIAVFGEKDYQQLQLIRRMTTDLNIPTQIIGAPIVRDPEGLALSSRNQYLSKEQYTIAIQLNRILFQCAENIQNGEDIQTSIEQAKLMILASGFEAIDYLELRDATTLLPVGLKTIEPSMKNTLRLLIVARIGGIRLLDNIRL